MPLFIAFAAGCQAEVELAPSWDTTAWICGWTAEVNSAEGAFLERRPYRTPACIDAVMKDFDVDEHSFLVADQLANPYVLLGNDDAVWNTRLGGLLWAAWALHTTDLGTLETVWQSDLIDPTVLSSIEETTVSLHSPNIQSALYDWVTSTVSQTQAAGPTREAMASFHTGTRTLVVRDVMYGFAGSALLVHEIRHDVGAGHIRCSFDAASYCDDGPDGSYGFQLAVLEIARQRTTDPIFAAQLLHQIEGISQRVQ